MYVNVTKMLNVMKENVKEFFFDENERFKYLKNTDDGFSLDREKLQQDFRNLGILKKEMYIGNSIIYYFNSTKVLGPGVLVVNRESGASGIFYATSLGQIYYFDSVFSQNGTIYKNVFEKNKIIYERILSFSDFYNKAVKQENEEFLPLFFRFFDCWNPKINTTISLITEASLHEIEGWKQDIVIDDFDEIFQRITSQMLPHQTVPSDPDLFKIFVTNMFILKMLNHVEKRKDFFDWDMSALIVFIKTEFEQQIKNLKESNQENLKRLFVFTQAHSVVNTGTREVNVYKQISFYKETKEKEIYFLDLFKSF